MIQSQGKWIAEEDECWYGEYGEMVDKKVGLSITHDLEKTEV